MDLRSMQKMLLLGNGMRLLRNAAPGEGARDVVSCWESIVRRLRELRLPTTPDFLESRLGGLMAILKGHHPRYTLKRDESEQINHAMGQALPSLMAEAAPRFVAIPSATKMKEEHLLEDPAALFHRGVFAKLPELAQQDFAEAAQCLAFSLCTAGACLIVRASECVLREFALAWGQPPPPKGWRGWGQVEKALRSKKPTTPPVVLLDELKQVGEYLRNPTQHPELRYNDDEVYTLFTRCIAAVNHMAKETKRISGC